MKLSEVTSYIRESLKDAGITESDGEARIILREVADISPAQILSHPEMDIDCDVQKRIEDIVNRRLMREPLQYILGSWDFMGLSFVVRPEVLIPRPDTEILVESALEELHDGMRVLDLCTGTGCVIISLLKYSNGCEGVAVDISEHALALAKENAAAIIPDETLEIIYSDLYENVEGEYDIIVSNPPYIDTDVIATLEPEVKDYEPHLALDGGDDGLDLVRRIIDEAGANLCCGGALLMEIGADQGERVCELMRKAGFVDVECVRDYAGLDRVVKGHKSFFEEWGIR